MKFIDFQSIKIQENTIVALFNYGSENIAKKIDHVWRVVHPDLDATKISQDEEELKIYFENICLDLKEKELQLFHKEIVFLKEEILNSPVLEIKKNNLISSLNDKIKKGLSYSLNNPNWQEKFNTENKFILGVESQLSKTETYSKLFSQVFKGLNPKATRNVFETNLQMFFQNLKIKNLLKLPASPAMDNVSKAFFRKSQSSVDEIISDLS
jgi:hypothetical protein